MVQEVQGSRGSQDDRGVDASGAAGGDANTAGTPGPFADGDEGWPDAARSTQPRTSSGFAMRKYLPAHILRRLQFGCWSA